MKNKYTALILGLFFISNFSFAASQEDTTFIANHIYKRYTSIIKKVDEAVRENKVEAYLDVNYAKQIISIQNIGESETQFTVKLPVAFDPTEANTVSDSTFAIALSNLTYITSIANYQMEMAKGGTPFFNLEGYGFGKIKNNNYTSIYYIKSNELKKILTVKELNFYLTVMEGSFVRQETKNADKTSTWKLSNNPIGEIDLIRLAYNIDTAMHNIFDSLFTNNLIPTNFAIKDIKGNIQYQLTEKSKNSMKLNSKIKGDEIRKMPVVLVEGDIFGDVQLGWKLENSYPCGAKSIMVVVMEEAVFLDKSMFLKYLPVDNNWERLLF